ncbi:MAG TPA: glycosyltransferase family 1 protein [Terriglobales bacterium]|jgi:glycosyltransferase involved in cell wall biosynthesis|nr:glycosyltransferase family 1 protein [Terriglobales bacterium]
MRISIFWNLGNNFSVDRYARELGENFPPEVEVHHVRYAVSSGWKGRIWDRHLKYLWRARREQGDFNIIASESCAFLLLALDARRTVVVCHGVQPLLYRERQPRGLWRQRYLFNLRRMARACHIVAVSEDARRDLLQQCSFLAPAQVTAVHHGLGPQWKRVEDPARLDALRRKHGMEGRRIVLCVGNETWYKNFDGALRAFASLQGSDLCLVKVGPCSAADRELAERLGLAGRWLYVPEAGDDELRAFYSAAELLLFPSWHESFGWPPLEAMACGCPVVASNRASVPEICGDACLFVDPNDTAGVTAATERVLTDPALRADLVGKGRLRVQEFNWGGTAKAMLQLLQHKGAR